MEIQVIKKLTYFTLGTFLLGTHPANSANDLAWEKTFPRATVLNIKRVSFKNRYGITLIGDVYMPKNH